MHHNYWGLAADIWCKSDAPDMHQNPSARMPAVKVARTTCQFHLHQMVSNVSRRVVDASLTIYHVHVLIPRLGPRGINVYKLAFWVTLQISKCIVHLLAHIRRWGLA